MKGCFVIVCLAGLATASSTNQGNYYLPSDPLGCGTVVTAPPKSETKEIKIAYLDDDIMNVSRLLE